MNPCYKCAERCEGCHGRCAAYIGWRGQRDSALKKMYRDKDVDSFMAERSRRTIRLAMRKRNIRVSKYREV